MHVHNTQATLKHYGMCEGLTLAVCQHLTSLAPLQKASKLFMAKIVEVQEETASMNQAQVELEVRQPRLSPALS